MSSQLAIPVQLDALLTQMLSANAKPASGSTDRPIDDVATHDFAVHEFVFDQTYGTGSLPALSGPARAYLASVRRSGVNEITTARIERLLIALENQIEAEAINIGPTSPQGQDWIALLTALYSQGMYISFLYQLDLRVQDPAWLVRSLMVDARAMMAGAGASVAIQAGTAWNSLMIHAFPSSTIAAHMNGTNGFTPRDVEFYELQVKGWPAFPTRTPTTGVLEWCFSLSVHTGNRQPGNALPAYEFYPAAPLTVNIGLRLLYRQTWRPLALQRGELVRTIPLGPGQKERISTKVVSRRKDTSTRETKSETEKTTEKSGTTKDSSEVVNEASDAFRWNVESTMGVKAGVFTGEVSGGVGGNSEDKSRQTSARLSEAIDKTASKMRSESKVVVSTDQESTFEQERASEIVNPNNEIAITYEYYRLQQQYDVFTYLHRVESVIYIAERVPSAAEVTVEWVRRFDWILARTLKDESFREDLAIIGRELETIDDPLAQGTDPFRGMMDAAVKSFAQFNAGSSATNIAIPDIYAAPQQSYRERFLEMSGRIQENQLRALRRNRLLQHIRDNILHYCRAIWAEEDADQRLMRYRKEGRKIANTWNQTVYATTNISIPGAPPPVFSASPWQASGDPVLVVDVIDPLGLLGYVGNYAVWSLKPTSEAPRLESVRPSRSQVTGINVGAFNNTISVAFLSANLLGLLNAKRAAYVDPTNGSLLDPALAGFRRQANAMSQQQLASITDEQVWDFLTYFPEHAARLLTASAPRVPNRLSSGQLAQPPTATQWTQYLYRANGTRRVLVDSNNLFLCLREGDGTALESFKRAHRYIDAHRAAEGIIEDRLKNRRRHEHAADAGAFDPDIDKVIVTGPSVVAVNPTPP